MRNRSSAVSITSNTKKLIRSEIGINETMAEKEKIEKFSNFMEKKLYSDNKFKKKSSISTEFSIDFPPPNFLDIKKEYYTKYEKV